MSDDNNTCGSIAAGAQVVLLLIRGHFARGSGCEVL